MCVGAYIGCFFANFLHMIVASPLLVLIISMLLGGVVAAIFGFIIGLPALRLKGDYLAIATLAFGEIVRNIFKNLPYFGGALGLNTTTFKAKHLFIVAFIMVIIVLVVLQNLIRSKHGRAITAIRNNEIAAKATGINVTKYKLSVFIVSAFFAGIAGVMYSFSQFTIQSTNFSYNYSIEILVMVVLGGMGSINGSIIAATVITFLDNFLQKHLTGDLAVLQDLFYALILIVLVIYNNAPALKNFREKHNLKAFINRFKPHNPSKHKDDEAKWARVPTKIKMDALLSTDMNPTSNKSIHGDISANDSKGGSK
jgi:branched-chain amino acid transport system permease protein